jgi:hypothetical protein
MIAKIQNKNIATSDVVKRISKRAAWTAASALLCFAAVNVTTHLQTRICTFQWSRPDTWMYTVALTGSPMCRMLSQTNTFFHHAAGNLLYTVI